MRESSPITTDRSGFHPVPSTSDRLLKAPEAAAVLGCSVRMVWRLAACEHLKVVKLGRASRFRESDVLHLVREGAA